MTTALQRLTKHTSAMHSMHKSTQLTTLASRNSPTNVSIVANTVSLSPAPQYAPTAAHKCDVKQNAQTTYGHILTCIPILFRQADVHPSQPNTPGPTHRAKSPLPFKLQTENIRPPRHKHRKKSSIGNSHTNCNSSAGHPYAGKEEAR